MVGRGPQHRRQGGGFGYGQVDSVLVEIILGGRLHAVDLGAQVDLVEIIVEDLVLGIVLFEFHGQQGLLDLAGQGLFPFVYHVLDQLHGKGGGALGKGQGMVGDGIFQVHHQGPGDAAHIHAVVLVKADVLRGDDRVLQALRYFVQLHYNALFAGVQRGQARSLFVQDVAGLGGLQILHADVRQGGGQMYHVDHAQNAGYEGHGQQDHQQYQQRMPLFAAAVAGNYLLSAHLSTP